MPYKTNSELPNAVKDNLPKEAQDIYKSAYNSAWEQYKDPKKRDNPDDSLEEVCHKVAWAAVKEKYHKDSKGNWVRDS